MKISQYPRWVRWLSWLPQFTHGPLVSFGLWMEFDKGLSSCESEDDKS